jgi:hypothetical protein
MRIFLNVALLGVAVSGFLIAGFSPDTVPEIDPGSSASALVILAGTLAVVRGRRKRSIPRS